MDPTATSGAVPRSNIFAALLVATALNFGVVGEVDFTSPTQRDVATADSPALMQTVTPAPVVVLPSPSAPSPEASLSPSEITLTPVVAATPSASSLAQVSRPAALELPPVSLNIPSQNIKAPVTMRAEIDEQSLLTAPDNPKQLGWWNAQNGVIVIDGHVGINRTPGALVSIDQLVPGDELLVEGSAKGIFRYRVVQTTSVSKGGLPSKYFTQEYSDWIMLITCGGSFNTSTGHYRSNIVVLARPE